MDTRTTMMPAVRLFAGVGVLGAFTTFSPSELETLLALERGHTGVALAASVLVGLAAVWLGARVGRLV